MNQEKLSDLYKVICLVRNKLGFEPTYFNSAIDAFNHTPSRAISWGSMQLFVVRNILILEKFGSQDYKKLSI